MLALLACVLLNAPSQDRTTINVGDRQVEIEPGYELKVYDVGHPVDRLYPLVDGQTPNVSDRRTTIDYQRPEDFGDHGSMFVARLTGYIRVQRPGTYAFRLTSDDGSRLTVNGTIVATNDGVHAATSVTGKVPLQPGTFPFQLDYFENDGGEVLRLEWEIPGTPGFVPVPAEAFFTEVGIVRVTSPGRKVLLIPGGPMRPGHGMPLDRVHPSYDVFTVRPASWEPKVGGMGLHPGGDLIVSTFAPNKSPTRHPEAPNGDLWRVSGVDETDRAKVFATKIADGFFEPAGVCCVDDAIYVSHRLGIEKLRDRDGDGTFEERVRLTDAWQGLNFHAFSFGLVEKAGYLYGALSVYLYTDPIDDVFGYVAMNGPNPPSRGSVFKVDTRSGRTEFICGGLRTPNGVGLGPDGAVYVTDNQGAWLPSSKLIRVVPGSFYGHRNSLAAGRLFPTGGSPSPFQDRPETPATVAMIQNEFSNSPTTPVTIPQGVFKGQMLVGEITQGGLNRVFLETVAGAVQGCAFRFTEGLEGGVNRVVMRKDGTIFVGCIGGPDEWSWKGTTFGLQRLTPNGKPSFEMKSVKATATGFEIEFTQTALINWLRNEANFTVTSWRYVATPEYGGPKLDETNHAVTLATPSADGRRVRLSVSGLKAGTVVHIRANPTSALGVPIWSSDAWYTLNRRP